MEKKGRTEKMMSPAAEKQTDLISKQKNPAARQEIADKEKIKRKNKKPAIKGKFRRTLFMRIRQNCFKIFVCLSGPILTGLLFGYPNLFRSERLAWVQAAEKIPAAEWIMKRVDENFFSGSKIITARMIIYGRRASRSLEFISYLKGEDKAFTEFLAPPREKGTKMLKLGDQLWTYSPAADRVILISGHMLRQSVMGSDLSYEDMMENRRLLDMYEASVIGEDKIIETDCWVLELKAKKGEVAYPVRKIWVDKERFLILKEERFARSGTLLKTAEVKKVSQFQRRWVPVQAIFKDNLKTGNGTEFIIDDIKFDQPIPDYIFTKASLK